MTPQEPAFLELSASVKRIENALLGEPMEGRKGIIHYHDQMTEDLYGVDREGKPIEGKNNTVLMRLSSMEDKQKKVAWIICGLLLAFTAIKAGFAAFVDKVFSK